MRFTTDTLDYQTYSNEELYFFIDELNKQPLEIDLMNDYDLDLFGSFLLVTDHEELIYQYIETATIISEYIMVLERLENYELCAELYRAVKTLGDRYIKFIVLTGNDKEAISKVNKVQRLIKRNIKENNQ